jgi:3-phosphoshikimate 1-carboxyvinyltransferase
MEQTFHPPERLRGEVLVPGDKSVTHRALLLGALSVGTTEIVHPGAGEDNHTTAGAIAALGVEVERADAEHWLVTSPGHARLRAPDGPIDCGNSGTTARLLAGMLAGLGIAATLEGDASLSGRPMRRVSEPLRDLGFEVSASPAGTLPLRIHGGDTASPRAGVAQASRVELAVASAQVKSALLFAALWGEHALEVVEPAVTRDHTERLFRAFGVRAISSSAYGDPLARTDEAAFVRLLPTERLRARSVEVPGDFSSAAYLLALGLLGGERVVARSTGINPTRAALLRVIERMGGRVTVSRRRALSSGEPVADLAVSACTLRGTTIEGAEVPLVIDELPLIAVLAAAADGETRVRDARELRVKETDRIAEVARLLDALGVACETSEDGFVVQGKGGGLWPGFAFDCGIDHRIALCAMVAAAVANGPSRLVSTESAAVSWPDFDAVLERLGVRVEPLSGGRIG